MIKLGIIGYPLGHSLSKVMHEAVIKELGITGSYDIMETNPEDLIQKVKDIKREGYLGFNVTIPFKELGRSEFERQLILALQERGIELIVLAGFMRILSADFTSRYPERILNIHPSLIPSFCGEGYYGLKVHRAALDYGVKVTGATVHFVNEVPDGGKIVAQKAVYIHSDDTPESLQKRVMREAEWIIFPEAIESVAGNIRRSK